MKVARVFLVATVLAFVIAFSNAACPAGLPANYYCRESTVNSSPYCNWITNSSNAVVLPASDGCARAITANTKLFGVSYKAFQVSNAGSVAFTPQPSNSLLAAQCTSTASNNICSTPKILNNYPLILAGRSAWTFNSKSSMVIGTIGAVPFRVRFFTWANFGSAVDPSDFQVQLFENGDRWERYSVLARRINAPTFETGTANFAANVPEVCNAAPIVDRCTEIFYVPPNPSLVVRSSIIYQGQLGELEASIDLGAASMDLGTVFEWDLDGDGVFGEVGSSADNGDEIGQYVQYRTIRRSGSVVTAGLHPVIVRARLIGVSAPSNLIATSSGQNVDVRNTRPTLTVAKTFNVVGSSTTLTASCSDPDGNSIDWDLDGDGVYGETGLAAANGDEVGSSVRFSTYVDTRERIIQVRSRCFDGTLYSPIAVSNVYVPGIQRQCSCQRGRAFDRLNSVNLYDSTFVDLINSNKLHLVSSAALTGSVATGSVFQKTPFTFNTFTESAFEICAEFEVETYAGLAGHPDVTDGGLSIIISKLSNSYPNAAGSSTGLIGRPGSSGVSVRWSSATADPSVVFGTTLGYSSSSFPAGFPINDRHRHQIQVRYWYTQLDVWIDGVLVHSTTVDLFPTNVWGTGPERTFYVGLAATTTTGYTQDIVVDTDFAVCKLNFASTP